MKEAFTFCIVFAIFIAGFALVSYIAIKITDFICEKRLAKRRKQHPELFQLIDECNKVGINQCKWYNQNISPKRIALTKSCGELIIYPRNKEKKLKQSWKNSAKEFGLQKLLIKN